MVLSQGEVEGEAEGKEDGHKDHEGEDKLSEDHENESCQMMSVSLNFDPKKYFSFYIADFPQKLFTKKIYNIIVQM